MAIRFAAKCAFQFQIALLLHQKEKARIARNHKRSAERVPAESPVSDRAVSAVRDRTCSLRAEPPLRLFVARADAALVLPPRGTLESAEMTCQAQTCFPQIKRAHRDPPKEA